MRSEQEVREKITELERQLELFKDRRDRQVDVTYSKKMIQVIGVLLVAHRWFLGEDNSNKKSNGKI